MDTPTIAPSRTSRPAILRLLFVALFGFACSAWAAPQSTPQETFESFKRAFAAKDGAAAIALMQASPADKEGLTKALPTLPDDAIQQITGAQLVDIKMDGDAALGIVMTVTDGKKKYDDQLFVKLEGKWFVTDSGVAEEKKKALNEWYEARSKELQEADKK